MTNQALTQAEIDAAIRRQGCDPAQKLDVAGITRFCEDSRVDISDYLDYEPFAVYGMTLGQLVASLTRFLSEVA